MASQDLRKTLLNVLSPEQFDVHVPGDTGSVNHVTGDTGSVTQG